MKENLKTIPSVDKILARDEIKKLCNKYKKGFVKKMIDKNLQIIRTEILPGKIKKFSYETFYNNLLSSLEKENRSLKRVVNATGIVLSTNLGRAPIPEKIFEQSKDVFTRYSNLELDLFTGKRGERYVHIKELFAEFSGAEDMLVVNNNASAVLLCLDTFAKDREVICSRGELIEIGGSFRLPDVLAKSGAYLIEVGTTNRTYLSDYENAITERTGILLKCHHSNFKMIGFTRCIDLKDLVALGRKHNILTMMDLGSGCPTKLYEEPTIKRIVATGIDIITFSGDKLLGGVQAGIILSKKGIIDRLKKNPLVRALRVDKVTLSILESLIHNYLYTDNIQKESPVLSMILAEDKVLKKKAERLARLLSTEGTENRFEVEIIRGFSETGGGSMPGESLSTYLVAIKSKKVSEDKILSKLRQYKTPIIVRIWNKRVVFDVRTLFDDDFIIIRDAVKWVR